MKKTARLPMLGIVVLVSGLVLYLHLVSGFVSAKSISEVNQQIGHVFTKISEPESPYKSLVFVGDLMLARNVEEIVKDKGYSYPYLQVKDFLTDSYAVANFEASIPEKHQQTEDFTFKFSVDKSVLEGLVDSGFRQFSLANNHSLDFGSEAYDHTLKTLSSRGFVASGHPEEISTSSVTYQNIENSLVSIVSLNATYGYPATSSVKKWLRLANGKSDYVVVYVHWGDEYVTLSNSQQKNFAYFLVDNGADLVVGHHPHVVQQIEKYKNSLIFYSLGNFVFDQYFSEEVQIGLMLRLTYQKQKVDVGLFPISSIASKASPQIITGENRDDYLKALADKSSESIQLAIETGEISLELND